VGAAEPAVDAEQLDAVGLTCENSFSGRRHAKREPCVVLPIAERRRRRQRLALLGLEQSLLPLSERGE